ncbi:MAG: energy transducer TonB [Alysiella sp.]|uniref:energy transducer TonB n=1 Tax=Alysiella sp. TaxID=1872483 RepID=UPI0026DD90C9|nr:energy transducer TonB [Alysiella sp.]MDO4433586.1 energy transducer TonB [Alysiella sp.]
MKNNRILTPATIAVVTLIHIGLIAAAWKSTTEPEPATIDNLTFVDLGSIMGDDQPMADGAPAPMETAPPPPTPEPPKPKEKEPEPKKPDPVKPKVHVVERDDRPADIVKPKESEPKPDLIKPKEPEPIKPAETPLKPTNTPTVSSQTNPQNRSPNGVAGGGGGTDPNSLRPGNPASDNKGGTGMGPKGDNDRPVDANAIHEAGTMTIPIPPYPTSARENDEQGLVRVEVIVEPDGSISSAKVVKSSGSRALDNAALRAVRATRGTPKKINGVSVRSRFIAPFNFKLD